MEDRNKFRLFDLDNGEYIKKDMTEEELNNVDWKATTAMADMLGVPPNFVYAMVKKGQLDPILKEQK